jgi:hypothetical protein
MTIFWDVAPCSQVEVYRRFKGACCLHHEGFLIMEAGSISETLVTSTRPHGTTTQKTVIFILAAVRTWDLTLWSRVIAALKFCVIIDFQKICNFYQGILFLHYKTTWRLYKVFNLAFSLTAITNEPLEPGILNFTLRYIVNIPKSCI